MSDPKEKLFGFETTQWSLVFAASEQVGMTRNELLSDLCGRYWRPLYIYARQSGQTSHAAEDLIQGFFAHLLSSDALVIADKDRGRFRTFLLSSLQNYIRKQYARSTAAKRGGGQRMLSLDIRDAEGELANQPSSLSTPESAFERQWALTVLDEAMSSLAQRYSLRGKSDVFKSLARYLSTDRENVSYTETASQLGMTSGAVKVAVHRLRREYREQLRRVVASTIRDEQDVSDELDSLLRSLSQ